MKLAAILFLMSWVLFTVTGGIGIPLAAIWITVGVALCWNAYSYES